MRISIKRIIVAVVVIVALFLTAKATVFALFEVNGSAMKSTLEDNTIIFVNKLNRVPERGDIVVFRSHGTDKDLKRVVGLPGETIVVRDGIVLLRTGTSDTVLPEPYLDAHSAGKTFRPPVGLEDPTETVYSIPAGEYFLLGDNRLGSLDSRSYIDDEGNDAPFIPAADIIGKVWFH